MILEDAYTSNPKPDKQARLEIVQRVSLNEKEVQVNHHLPRPATGCLTTVSGEHRVLM